LIEPLEVSRWRGGDAMSYGLSMVVVGGNQWLQAADGVETTLKRVPGTGERRAKTSPEMDERSPFEIKRHTLAGAWKSTEEELEVVIRSCPEGGPV
jgi:hypothetical protein